MVLYAMHEKAYIEASSQQLQRALIYGGVLTTIPLVSYVKPVNFTIMVVKTILYNFVELIITELKLPEN